MAPDSNEITGSAEPHRGLQSTPDPTDQDTPRQAAARAKREQIKRTLVTDPGATNTAIARACKVSRDTVRRVRRDIGKGVDGELCRG